MSVLYRYDASWMTPLDDGFSIVDVCLHTFPVLRTTLKGAWIDVHGVERFVLSGVRKRFAWPTVDEARTSFLARKRRHIQILESQLSRARQELARFRRQEGLESVMQQVAMKQLPRLM